ncbi:N,N-dimethylformamidase beta subunit [Stieleria neptunia]|uniref:N,N-dimethylformamidase beta subunit n=1 Tax=Stieleria neptunia TaxID=2527979 RepID=A0A518HTB9_9BACT|nr:N,N-dimethylformamidase beta subunit family domain-containing protein [Stieleria neptunia]QDV44082.1 N,N-dimethylformamidase beta subunit [Stieleria neptunia]
MVKTTFRLMIWATMMFGVLNQCNAEQMPPAEPYVFGYTDQLSYVAGESVAFHLSSSQPRVDLTITRVGAQREQVHREVGVACAAHPIPDRASSDGCNWPTAWTLTVPDDWKTGYYEVAMKSGDDDDVRGSLFFVVRAGDSQSKSKILLQLSTNTYNAYTNWGGHSLYSYHDRDGLQGHQVSFDRPINSQFGNWELPFVRWAEANGFSIDFAVNSDLEFHPEILKNYKLVLSVGHDEYWSSPMRDHLERFIRDGGNVAFFSGNTCCWQVRSGSDGRTLTSWKQTPNMDPLYRTGDHRLLSTAWSHHLVGRPENELTGVGFLWGGYHRSHGQFMDGSGAFTVHQPDHWLFKGTGLKQGDAFGGKDSIVGYECDGCEMKWIDGVATATHNDGTPQSFQILGTCEARWAPGDSYWYDRFPTDRVGAAVLGVYTSAAGGTVVTAGTTDWAHGLRGADPAVVQITKNVLDRLSQ